MVSGRPAISPNARARSSAQPPPPRRRAPPRDGPRPPRALPDRPSPLLRPIRPLPPQRLGKRAVGGEDVVALQRWRLVEDGVGGVGILRFDHERKINLFRFSPSPPPPSAPARSAFGRSAPAPPPAPWRSRRLPGSAPRGPGTGRGRGRSPPVRSGAPVPG